MSFTFTTSSMERKFRSIPRARSSLRLKKTGPNTYEGSTTTNGRTTKSKTTISSDGKVMTVEST